MKKIICMIAVIVCFAAQGFCDTFYSDESEAGGSMTELFSDFAQNARAAGLGRAYTAQAADVSAPFWNPAGISKLYFNEASITDMNLFLGTQYTNAGLAYPFDRNNIFAVNLARIVSGQAARTDSLGQSLGYSFGEISSCYLITYSRRLNDKLSAGVNLKTVSREIDTYSAQGSGFDFGLIYDYADDTVYGVSLQNVPEIQAGSDKAGSSLTCGLSREFIKDRLNFCLDLGMLDMFSKKNFSWASGIEYSPAGSLWLRCGANPGDFSLGFGVRAKAVSFNYALGMNSIDFVHQLSINLRYGFMPGEREIRLDKQEKELAEEKKRFGEEKKNQEEKIKKSMEELKLENMVKVRLAIAQDYFKADNFSAAEDVLKQVIKKAPDNPDAKYMLQEIYRRTKGSYIAEKYAKALDFYQKGEYKAAAEENNKVLALVPEHEGAGILSLLCQAQLNIQQKKYQEAKNELIQVLTLDTEQNEAASLLKRVQAVIELEEGR